MTVVHELESKLFAGLAGGLGGAAGIRALREAQLSKHLLLIAHLLAHWPGPAGERDAVADALDEARTRAPERFREIIGAPLVGGWVAIVARALHRGQIDPADFRHLTTLAMAACAAAGVDAAGEVPVRDGLVAVPGLGAARVGSATGARLTVQSGRMAVVDGAVTVEVPADVRETAEWLPVRRLVGEAAGMRLSLGLDDLDPYRHGHHAPPAPRLPAAEVDRWRGVYAVAWELLAVHLPDRAAELMAGLRTLVPLVAPDDRSARSATLRHAFGVFGLTRPPSPADFAVTMVHEFQHSKLSAILDVVPLTDPADERTYFAPWRTDPRPLAGLLQGVYAFVGVADAWRALRAADALTVVAEKEFSYARLQVHAGLTAIEESGALTGQGQVLAAHLRRTTDAFMAEPVAASAAQAAERELAETRERWTRRNAVMT